MLNTILIRRGKWFRNSTRKGVLPVYAEDLLTVSVRGDHYTVVSRQYRKPHTIAPRQCQRRRPVSYPSVANKPIQALTAPPLTAVDPDGMDAG